MKFNNESKLLSRKKTIIDNYRIGFNEDKIQLNRQYWTLCADLLDKESGNPLLLENSELDQLLKENFLESPDSFHGVDIDQTVIDNNKKLSCGNYYCGDFFGVLSKQKNLNPAVINLDLLRTFETEKNLIRKFFLLLSPYNKVLFNINVLFENHNVKFRDPEDAFTYFSEELSIRRELLNCGWRREVGIYPYKGLGKITKMISFTFLKN